MSGYVTEMDCGQSQKCWNGLNLEYTVRILKGPLWIRPMRWDFSDKTDLSDEGPPFSESLIISLCAFGPCFNMLRQTTECRKAQAAFSRRTLEYPRLMYRACEMLVEGDCVLEGASTRGAASAHLPTRFVPYCLKVGLGIDIDITSVPAPNSFKNPFPGNGTAASHVEV